MSVSSRHRFENIAYQCVCISLVLVIGLVTHSPAYAQKKDTPEFVKRVPPIMPREAFQSGYCCMSYDIDAAGKTKNIRANYCTEDYLATPSIIALEQWVQHTKRKDGSNVDKRDWTTFMSFRLTDQFGNMIPGKHGFMTKQPDGTYRKEKPCGFLTS